MGHSGPLGRTLEEGRKLRVLRNWRIKAMHSELNEAQSLLHLAAKALLVA